MKAAETCSSADGRPDTLESPVAGFARTVLGDVPASELGVVLPHEHVFFDWRVWASPGAEAERVTLGNRETVARNPTGYLDCLVLDDRAVATAELLDFKRSGGGGILDVTPEVVGRNPSELAAVARATGVHVIAGCGPYVERTHPPRLRHMSPELLAEELIQDVAEGLDGTRVRAGIIGEIGTSDPIGPGERKALKAAAIAQQATGCAITVHVHMGARTGHEILSVIEDEGGDLSRVVLGHLDVHLSRDYAPRTAVEHHAELANRGCYIEYDLCGVESLVRLATGQTYHHPTDDARAEAVAELVELGYATQLLLSHDVGKKIQLKSFGGAGYGHTLTGFKERLEALRLTPEALHEIYVANPQRVATMAASRRAA